MAVRTASIAERAWRRGLAQGAAEGAVEVGRLVRRMSERPERAADPTAVALCAAARALEEDPWGGAIHQRVSGVDPPAGLAEQLYWTQERSGSADDKAVTEAAWQHGYASGVGPAGVLARHALASAVAEDATLDGLPVREWLNLALTPVADRRADELLTAGTVSVARQPTTTPLTTAPRHALAIAAQAHQLDRMRDEAEGAPPTAYVGRHRAGAGWSSDMPAGIGAPTRLARAGFAAPPSAIPPDGRDAGKRGAIYRSSAAPTPER